MNEDLKQIKKYYGENMMHLCRSFFPTILETEGLLFKLISEHFDYSKFLYKDIVDNKLEEEFKNYIFSFIDVENNNEEILTKTPSELLGEAGYILYECHSEEEIQSFKKYYAAGEELCTFNGNRLDRCHVFFAIKKDVENIKREDFTKPNRQDLYGTSVISIQFARGNINILSIKNRYNHTVNNPDATFSNNLDNIIPGLTKSFEETYNLNINSENNSFELPGYVRANDRKYYKYNCEINNIYYCPNNIIIDNFKVIKDYQEKKERYIILDYFIFDMKEKTIKLYDNKFSDSFVDEIPDIEKITLEVDKETDTKKININNFIEIVIDKLNRITKYENNLAVNIGDLFLCWSHSLQEINLPQVQQIGDDFLSSNNSLQEINLPQVKTIGNYFLCSNNSLQEISLPQVKTIGNYFLSSNNSLQEINLPQVQQIGDDFLTKNNSLQEISLPQVKTIGNDYLFENNSLQEINLPQVKTIGICFLYCNNSLQEISLPQVQQIGDDFLTINNSLQEINLPNLQEIECNLSAKIKAILNKEGENNDQIDSNRKR